MTYPNLTDEEIQKLMDAIGNILSNMKSDIKKKKFKVFGKTLLSLVVITGGVAISIIFPNPITIAILGGAATLIAGNSGILSKTKKIREKSKERKKNKEEVKNLNTEQSNRKLTKHLQSIISQQEIKNNKIYEDYVPEPSAPNLYPDLKKLSNYPI